MTKKTVSRGPRSIDLTLVQEWQDGRVRRFQDYLVGEEPLEIRVGKHALSVTMRTPGQDLELAAGFLDSGGVIHRREEIAAIVYSGGGRPAQWVCVVQNELAWPAAM